MTRSYMWNKVPSPQSGIPDTSESGLNLFSLFQSVLLFPCLPHLHMGWAPWPFPKASSEPCRPHAIFSIWNAVPSLLSARSIPCDSKPAQGSDFHELLTIVHVATKTIRLCLISGLIFNRLVRFVPDLPLSDLRVSSGQGWCSMSCVE